VDAAELVRLPLVKIAGVILAVPLLWALLFGLSIFGVPTVYGWWKHVECWLRGPDSYACWELDLLRHSKRVVRRPRVTRPRRP
jgi:hypothetical protein